MNLQYRIELLTRLGDYILSDSPEWLSAKQKAEHENGWFIPEFVSLACNNIADKYLQKNILESWTSGIATTKNPKAVGIVMAGNIPLVGFHDWLCVFVTGHIARIKMSSKDNVLLRHLLSVMESWAPGMSNTYEIGDMLKNCDAYIATGSNNSSRYFDYYFGKYPHIIRRNRTSVAVLSGEESMDDLERLGDDVHQYFGLGCRNVTKIFVPRDYDFVPLLAAFKKYHYLADHHKYKNNYDYNLAIHLLNKVMYMTNGSILLVENPSLFSPISQLNYSFYEDRQALLQELGSSTDIQCIVGAGGIPPGKAQSPAIDEYADAVNTMAFLENLG
jgi:hypothetical protein